MNGVRAPLAVDWPWMIAPWGVFGSIALAWPLLAEARSPKSRSATGSGSRGSGRWGNLSAFGLWTVAQPNYFLPQSTGAMAILAGLTWVRLSAVKRKRRTVEDRLGGRYPFNSTGSRAVFTRVYLLPLIVHRTCSPRASGLGIGVWPGVVGRRVVEARVWRLGGDAGAARALWPRRWGLAS